MGPPRQSLLTLRNIVIHGSLLVPKHTYLRSLDTSTVNSDHAAWFARVAPVPGWRDPVEVPMTRVFTLLLAGLLVTGLMVKAEAGGTNPETVIVPSGDLKLHALLWRPPGRGPFPAVLFNHGSGHAGGVDASGRHDHRHPELLGPVFARHGYIFLYLFRRGDGLSAGQGVPAGDRMDAAFAASGQEERNRVQLQVLETDELNDGLAGLAFLRTLPDVDPRRMAVVGHSFGASVTFLLAERDSSLRAAIMFSIAGYSWDRSPQLRARLTAAADHLVPAAFFINAENDYSLAASRDLSAELERLRKPTRLKVYPPVGHTPDDGHDFIHSMIPSWETMCSASSMRRPDEPDDHVASVRPPPNAL
jgi:dienelactone hydrolase